MPLKKASEEVTKNSSLEIFTKVRALFNEK